MKVFMRRAPKPFREFLVKKIISRDSVHAARALRLSEYRLRIEAEGERDRAVKGLELCVNELNQTQDALDQQRENADSRIEHGVARGVQDIRVGYNQLQAGYANHLQLILRQHFREIDPKLVAAVATPAERFNAVFRALGAAEASKGCMLAPICVYDGGAVLYRARTFDRYCKMGDEALSNLVFESFEKAGGKDIRLKQDGYDLFVTNLYGRGSAIRAIAVGAIPQRGGKTRAFMRKAAKGAMPLVRDAIDGLEAIGLGGDAEGNPSLA